MTTTISLNGNWKLYGFPQGKHAIGSPEALRGEPGLLPLDAAVPGNVELALLEAGQIPDPYRGDNIHLLKAYEMHEWWYETTFAVGAEAAPAGRRCELVFHGVDCFATYWLNGEPIGESDNMLIEHKFDVTGRLAVDGAVNTLTVRLKSPLIEAMKRPYDPSSCALPVNFASLWVRKAAHGYGWDIFGRAVSAGLWRSVELVVHDVNEVADVHVATASVGNGRAELRYFYRLNMDPHRMHGSRLRVRGRCGDSTFEQVHELKFTYGSFLIPVDKPQLWWPRDFGSASLYEVTTELLADEGEVLAVRTDTIGIRTIELLRTDVTTLERPGQFLFKVNGVPILIKGSNWVPMDIFHSKDAAKYERAIELAVDLNCNMLRSWGGNVYEDHAFFDLCDRNGILVWQDFAMACGIYPQDPEFQEILRREATSVVRKLRNHPSLAVWCGDNECDEFYLQHGLDPSTNVLTRRVLPDVVKQCDPYRPFVPSSPYISPEAYAFGSPEAWPERHLWGVRDYYKSDYYTEKKSLFAGEMGYHGCTNLSSIRRYVDADRVWPWQDNSQWITHATDPVGSPDSMYRFRLDLMANQIGELFGEIPDEAEPFIVASQISQAEAKKYFIERVRLNKWNKTGVLWWNLLDGWPQFSDAVVDYYYVKKLAYHYIKRVQQPVCVMVDEPAEWGLMVKVGNDSSADASGDFRVWDADSGETLLSGSYAAESNGLVELGKIRMRRSAQRMLLIEWTADGRKFGNHYLAGSPGFSLPAYRRWMKQIAELPLGFDADGIGK